LQISDSDGIALLITGATIRVLALQGEQAKVKRKVPPRLGHPNIKPVVPERERPGGRAPATTLQETGAVQPGPVVRVGVKENGPPTAAAGGGTALIVAVAQVPVRVKDTTPGPGHPFGSMKLKLKVWLPIAVTPASALTSRRPVLSELGGTTRPEGARGDGASPVQTPFCPLMGAEMKPIEPVKRRERENGTPVT
jgi:hypothetical protein